MFDCKECQKVYKQSEDKNDPDLCRCVKCAEEYEESKSVLLAWGHRHSFYPITESFFESLDKEKREKILDCLFEEFNLLKRIHNDPRLRQS
jgi:hypothetical protein